MDNYKMENPLVLAQTPLNRYVALVLPEPLPTYDFAIPSPMLLEPRDVDVLDVPPLLKIRYRLVNVLGATCIYEYEGWKYEGE